MAQIRLDKLLSQSGEHTRSESAALIRSGWVTVNGTVRSDPSSKVDTEVETVCLKGQPVSDAPYQYVMLYKPAGVLTAARDSHAATVMDLLPEAFRRRDVLPVGRLDKDTTGLLLVTNDGELAHRLLSPARHVWKEYLAEVDGALQPADVDAFAAGMALTDFVAMPAELQILETTPDSARAIVRVREGKFHQVKRMFHARGREVLQLHRQTFGPLRLTLAAPGDWRFLTAEEIAALRAAAQGNLT